MHLPMEDDIFYVMSKEERSEVLQGTLDLMVLKTLEAMGPQHGYGIARRIEQISDGVRRLRAIGMLQIGEPRQVEQNEGELERSPGTIRRIGVDLRQVGRALTADRFGVDRVRALEPHGAVREPEGLPRDFFGPQQFNRPLEPISVLATVPNILITAPTVPGKTLRDLITRSAGSTTRSEAP